MLRYHVINFGCRANQADGAALEQQLAKRGFNSARGIADADVLVLNSCTVTAGADYALRQAARKSRRVNPLARIVITGCYAQRSPDLLATLPEVDWVVGNSHKNQIARLVDESCGQRGSQPQFVPLQSLNAGHPGQIGTCTDAETGSAETIQSANGPAARILHGDIFVHQELLTAPVFSSGGRGERTRPNIKVQDGCDNRCSFCVIPYVRGRSRSISLEQIVEQIRSLSAGGYQEVVLSGINLGRWGRDFNAGRMHLAQLIRAILEQTPIARLRLSSVEPMDFTDELLDLMAASPRITKHVHAPLQSGSDRILRRMHRKYHPQNYRNRMEAAYARMPNAAFGADVMVGFPGESAADFEETRKLIDSLPFTYLHVFPFSRRPGTPADSMPQQVHGAAVHQRACTLRELAAQKNRRFRERQIGVVLEVVTLESDDDASGTAAISDNFLDVLLPGVHLPANRLTRVKITGLSAEGLTAELVESISDTSSEINSRPANANSCYVAERPDTSLVAGVPEPSIITSAIA